MIHQIEGGQVIQLDQSQLIGMDSMDRRVVVTSAGGAVQVQGQTIVGQVGVLLSRS